MATPELNGNVPSLPREPTLRERLLVFWLDWENEPLFIEVRRKVARNRAPK